MSREASAGRSRKGFTSFTAFDQFDCSRALLSRFKLGPGQQRGLIVVQQGGEAKEARCVDASANPRADAVPFSLELPDEFFCDAFELESRLGLER